MAKNTNKVNSKKHIDINAVPADISALWQGNIKITEQYACGGKFARDVNSIIPEYKKISSDPDNIDWFVVVRVLNNGISFHTVHKIAGIQSLDSSSHMCGFCDGVRKAAENNDRIICGYCYDHAQERRMPTVLARHWLNMFILSNFDIPAEYMSRLAIYTNIFRFNSSGDIANFTHALNLYKIMIAFPGVQFGLYSKNKPVVEKLFSTYGKPANCRYVQSSLLIDKAAIISKYADITFTVYTADMIDAALSAGDNECNGKMCAACGWKCYKPETAGGWITGTNTAELLRV